MFAILQNSIDESCRVKQELRAACAEEIITAAKLMAGTIKKGGRILACGNGGSAADSQHLAAELVGRFKTDRKPLPAIALTTDTSIITSIANDYGYDHIFSRQVAAHGTKKDLLIIYTTSGNSPNVIEAAKTAKKIGMKTIGITGCGG
ncbi:MAG: SIS domain-containing protein, partial [bacterium]